jgi:hypothetical protein
MLAVLTAAALDGCSVECLVVEMVATTAERMVVVTADCLVDLMVLKMVDRMVE